MRHRPRNLDELEEMAEIRRNVLRAPTQNDIMRLRRQKLGRLWGRARRKMEGWPR